MKIVQKYCFSNQDKFHFIQLSKLNKYYKILERKSFGLNDFTIFRKQFEYSSFSPNIPVLNSVLSKSYFELEEYII